jgi:hypothetical protein
LVRLKIYRPGEPVFGRMINRKEHKSSESSVTRPVTNCPDTRSIILPPQRHREE